MIENIILIYLILIIVGVVLLIIKGVALQTSAKNKQNIWFWVMFLIQTAGILPIIYLIFFRKKRK